MGTRRLKQRLERRFGKAPDPFYFHGDMEYIRAYYDFRRSKDLDAFLLDDITWNDLDMNRVFQRINPALSTSGEQYLYYMLRSPAIDRETYAARKTLIDFVSQNPSLRLKLQVLLAKLGCTRRADLCKAFSPSSHGRGRLLLYCIFLLLVPASLVFWALYPSFGLLAPMAVLTFNAIVHEYALRRVQKDFDTVNYSVFMIFTLHRIRKLRNPGLDAHLQDAYKSLDRLRAVIRTGGISTVGDNGGAGDFITTLLLLDLIAYEFLKNKLGCCHEDMFAVHEALGKLDAAIAVASYRQSVETFSEPELDFAPGLPYLRAADMVHPLIDSAVPNDLETERSILITGSNASGKSTYLKTAALCAIMAQSICTCTARCYSAKVYRIFSSMALRDDLSAGESYYIVETKSLKRILDGANGTPPVLCVIDEVLRGTNTVERIAASSVILRTLSETGALCLAATHDTELCNLLEAWFSLYHFEEQVGENEMHFDYRICRGRANSRNAINLLKLMGFDEVIVQNAHARANRYLEQGVWR